MRMMLALGWIIIEHTLGIAIPTSSKIVFILVNVIITLCELYELHACTCLSLVLIILVQLYVKVLFHNH